MKKLNEIVNLYERTKFLWIIIFVIILFIALILFNNLKNLYYDKSNSNSNTQNIS